MADADVLPYDYGDTAKAKAETDLGTQAPNFEEAIDAASHFQRVGATILAQQKAIRGDAGALNRALLEAERALLIPEGLPHRPWYHHAIYAPGEYTGYAAVVIPGVNEAIEKRDSERTRSQLNTLTAALNRAAKVLESYR